MPSNQKPAYRHPYSFVKLTREKQDKQTTPPAQAQLLEITEPVIFHDHHSAPGETFYTGEIDCSLYALTPLLVGNLHEKKKDEPTTIHWFRFPDGELGISSFSLRGMVGQVVNTLCNKPMERVKDETFTFRPNVTQDQNEIKWSAGVIVGKNGRGESVVREVEWKNIQMGQRKLSIPNIVFCGNGFERVFNEHDNNYQKYFRQWHSTQLMELGETVEIPASPPIKYDRDGYKQKWSSDGKERLASPCITRYYSGIDGGNRYYQYGFQDFRKYGGYEHIACTLTDRTFTLPEDCRLQYLHTLEIICKEHFDRHPSIRKNIKKAYDTLRLECVIASTMKEEEFSKEVRGKISKSLDDMRRLKPLDFVFFEHRNNNTEILTFGRNYRYRWAYENSVCWIDVYAGKQIDKLRPEIGYTETEKTTLANEPWIGSKLNPARSLFGFTRQGDYLEKDDPADFPAHFPALAGKLSFSFAKLQNQSSIEVMRKVTLRELSTPKASAVEHYIDQSNYNGKDHSIERNYYFPLKDYGDPAKGVAYEGELAGRKYYLHASETKISSIGAEEKNDRLACGEEILLQPGNHYPHFTFQIKFNKLRDWELGMLIWALALPDKSDDLQLPPPVDLEKSKVILAHKLGYGRPLGMGSVAVRVDELRLLGQQFTLQEKNGEGITCLKGFFEKMKVWYRVKEFEQCEPVVLLKKVLRFEGTDEQLLGYHIGGKKEDIVGYHSDLRNKDLKARRKNTDDRSAHHSSPRNGETTSPFSVLNGKFNKNSEKSAQNQPPQPGPNKKRG